MYDYVIVGGGAAGCVLAYRLSENPNTKVAVIEYGQADWYRKMMVRMPLGMVVFMMPNLAFLGGPKMMYVYKGEPNEALGGNALDLPRGKALGGSSMVNGMIYIRGQREDYDQWVDLGAPGWGYEDLLPCFKRSENFELAQTPDYTPDFRLNGALIRDQIDMTYHGVGGHLNVAPPRSPNRMCEVYFEACRQAGYRLNPDFNGASQEGIGYHWLTQKGGERWGIEMGYGNAIKQRPNVDILTEARVLKLLFEGKRAVGVEIERDGKRETIRAGETIMAAGTFNTPQILMLSGIGPGEELTRHGITPLHALRGVGQNLQDHLDTWIKQKSKTSHTYGISWQRVHSNAAHIAKWFLGRRGMFTSNTAEAGGFVRSHDGADRPDLQLFFCTTIASAQAADSFFGHGWAMHATDLRPKSVGHVGLKSRDPYDQPLIQHNFAQDDRDMQNLVRGIHIMRKITDQPAFKDHVGVELEPGRDVQSDDELRAYIKTHCMTMYHPTSTCRLGTDDKAVVDPASMRVHGVDGLRIADASVFPTVISGNTLAPTIAVAEKAADLIRATA